MENNRETGAIDRNAVYVVATSHAGTKRAFETAARRARAQGVRVIVIVPHPVPTGLDRCGCDLLQVAESYCAFAQTDECRTTVVVCICREMCDVCQMIPANPSAPSHVVVAGHHPWWHRSREERLARALQSEGRAVEFVDLGRPRGGTPFLGTF